MDTTVKLLFKSQTADFYDIFNDAIGKEFGNSYHDDDKVGTLGKCWNPVIENRQERCEFFCKSIGLSSKAGPNETENFTMKTKPILLSKLDNGYRSPTKYYWPVYETGNIISGAVGVDTNGHTGILTFCVSVIFEGLYGTRSRPMNGEASQKRVVLFSKLYTMSPCDVDISEGSGKTGKLSSYDSTSQGHPDKVRMILFPFDIPVSPTSDPSLQPLGGSDNVFQIHALYTRVRIYSEEGVLKSAKRSSTGLWIEPKMERDLSAAELTVQRDYFTGLFGTSGKISCVVKLPRRYFARGESIPITLKVTNATSHSIERVVGCVTLEGKATTDHICFNYSTKPETFSEISPNRWESIDLRVPMTFASADLSNALLPVSPERYSLIDFNYVLNVTLVRSGFHRNIVIPVPINVTSCSQFF